MGSLLLGQREAVSKVFSLNLRLGEPRSRQEKTKTFRGMIMFLHSAPTQILLFRNMLSTYRSERHSSNVLSRSIVSVSVCIEIDYGKCLLQAAGFIGEGGQTGPLDILW